MPLANVPKAPKQFATYQYYRIKAKVLDYLAILSLRWQSKKTMFTKAAMGINRGKALAAGKALHARLGQAMASGDRGELRQIAMPRLYESLAATLDKRDRHTRATWEIITNHGARLVAHRCALLPKPFPDNMVVEQAVVAIDTTQKLERYDARTNELVPGSTKVQRRTEYVGIHRSWNKKTNESDAWSLLGNTKETTLEDWNDWLFYEQQQAQDNVNKKLKQAREGTL
jgi:protein MBA1